MASYLNKIIGREKKQQPKNDPESGVVNVQSANDPEVVVTSTDSGLVFTKQLAPGIFVPEQPKKKKKKRIRPRKNLEGIYQKTSKGLTPPSYFCSSFTGICGFICFLCGMIMMILAFSVDAYQTNTPSANFMRVGGGVFVVTGFLMMTAGLFYFLLVFMRHRGIIGKKPSEKQKVTKQESESEEEGSDDEKQDKFPYKGGNETGSNTKKFYIGSSSNDLSSMHSDKGRRASVIKGSETNDNVTIFEKGQSTSNLTTSTSAVSINKGKFPTPQRRQSIAVVQGITESGNDTELFFRNPDVPIFSQRQSETDLTKLPPINPKSKLPPISGKRRGSIAVEFGMKTTLNKLDEIVKEEGVNDSMNDSRGNRAHLFQATNPTAPGSVTTPKIFKKSKSSADFGSTPVSDMSSMSPRPTPDALLPKMFERQPSFDKYVRNK